MVGPASHGASACHSHVGWQNCMAGRLMSPSEKGHGTTVTLPASRAVTGYIAVTGTVHAMARVD